MIDQPAPTRARHTSRITAALIGAASALTVTTVVPIVTSSAPVEAETTTRFGQLNLYVNRLDDTSEFYQTLGFEELFRFPEDEPIFGTLRRGDFYLTLTTYDAIRDFTDLRRVRRSPLHQFDIVVLVDDVDATVDTLRAAGYRILQEPTDQPFGERQAYAKDPEGNYVQISTESSS